MWNNIWQVGWLWQQLQPPAPPRIEFFWRSRLYVAKSSECWRSHHEVKDIIQWLLHFRFHLVPGGKLGKISSIISCWLTKIWILLFRIFILIIGWLRSNRAEAVSQVLRSLFQVVKMKLEFAIYKQSNICVEQWKVKSRDDFGFIIFRLINPNSITMFEKKSQSLILQHNWIFAPKPKEYSNNIFLK